MRRAYLLLLIVLLAIQPGEVLSASPRTLVVSNGSPCASGDATFTSLSSALTSANPGDRILVCPGTYRENVRVTKSSIVISGVGDPSSVILEALNTTKHVVEVVNVRNVTLSNLSMRGAIGSQQSGLYVYLSSESVFRNIMVTGNYFGLNLVSSSGIRVESLISENNTNAGVNLEGSIACNLSSLRVRGNRIGLISLLSSDIRVSGASFTGNSEGGLLLKYSDNNTISDVEARENGWYGIYLQKSRGNVIENSRSLNNTALGADGYGIYLHQGSSGNLIRNTSAMDNVYGIKVYSSDGNLINASVINNTMAGILVESSRGNRIGGSVRGSIYGVWIVNGGENEFSGESGYNRYGVLIFESANNSVRGATVHDNLYTGIVVEGNSSIGNVFTMLSSYNNTILGIDLGGDYVTRNDGRITEGPNHLMDYPVLLWAGVYGSRMIVRGYINAEGNSSGNPAFDDAEVEIYQSTGHPSGYGEGLRYLGSLRATNGLFMGWIDLPDDLHGKGMRITSLATLMPHGTSEFGPSIFAPALETNLTLVKAVEPSVVTPGSEVRVSLLITNYGNGTAYNVTLTDSLPDGMSYVAGTAKLNGSSEEPKISGNNLSWILNVPSGSSLLLEFNATVSAPPGTTLKNVATFSSQEGSGSDSSEISVISPPVIRVRKLASPTNVKVGNKVDYTVVISNSGDLPAFLMISDRIPSGMSYVDGSFSSNITVEGPLLVGSEMRYNVTLGPRSSVSVSYKLKAETEGRKDNKVYVNGTIGASASIVVMDPPSPPPGGGSGSRPRDDSGTPSCGYLPPPNPSSSSGNPVSEKKEEYVLTGIPIVLVSLGSQGIRIESYGTTGSSGSTAGSGGSAASGGTSGTALITVDISATPTSVETGGNVAFLVKVSNIGDGAYENLEVLVDLSAGLDYVAGSSKLGGVRVEPRNERNVLKWTIGKLDAKSSLEINFLAKLVAVAGSYNVVATAAGAKDSVIISVKPKEVISQPAPVQQAPELVDLDVSSSSSGMKGTVRIILTSPTGAQEVKVVANLNASIKYVPGSVRSSSTQARVEVNENVLSWTLSISKGRSVEITFDVEPAADTVTSGRVDVFLTGFGKQKSTIVRFEAKQKSIFPALELKLPEIPMWIFLLPLLIIPVLLAYRRRGREAIVMDYAALRIAAGRGKLDDLARRYEIYIPNETFNKVARDQSLMRMLESYFIGRSIIVERAPKELTVEGYDEEISAVLSLAERKGAFAYLGDEDAFRRLRERGLRVKLMREGKPPALEASLP